MVQKMSNPELFHSLLTSEISTFIMGGMPPESRNDVLLNQIVKATGSFTKDLIGRCKLISPPRGQMILMYVNHAKTLGFDLDIAQEVDESVRQPGIN